jgi:hypothetical protein
VNALTVAPVGDPVPVELVVESPTFNWKEARVMDALRSAPEAMTLEQLAASCFPKSKKANSWARNSLRKPVRLGLARKVARGTYGATRRAA